MSKRKQRRPEFKAKVALEALNGGETIADTRPDLFAADSETIDKAASL